MTSMRMAEYVAFEPMFSIYVLAALCGLSFLLCVFLFLTARRNFLPRLFVFTALLLCLANPVLLKERRTPLRDTVMLVVDSSQSQKLSGREALSNKTASQLRTKIQELKDFDLKFVETDGGTSQANAQASGTRLMAALDENLVAIPPERLAAVLLVTDGQVHDAPQKPENAQLRAPLHLLLTGKKNERDRRLIIEKAPQYGIVGTPMNIALRVEDEDDQAARSLRPQAAPRTAMLTLAINGNPVETRTVPVGRNVNLRFVLAHAGTNILDIAVSKGQDELSLENNRAILTANGVRDHLRVLLVSGEPHAGERTWRNLLKADPSVDLVHFTILRPPEKQDGTPLDELALIAFPVRELFSIKLDQFDLIIFDRYERRGVLPQVYLANVARFVENGGALLAAAGPGFAGPSSLYHTPLASVLPARPTGQTAVGGFRPQITQDGRRHPVTAGLGATEGAGTPQWGRWFRLMNAQRLSGTTLMSGPQNLPVLILDHVGQGRVAQLLSDQSWLWARGFEGGGPQAELLRRLAHWLMKEPDLEEEKISARVENGVLVVERQSMAEHAGPVFVTPPSGAVQTQTLEEIASGRFEARLGVNEPGIYHVRDGALAAITSYRRADALELSDLRTTEKRLAPLTQATDGGVFWMGERSTLPDIRMVERKRRAHGEGWLGLRKNNQYVVEGVKHTGLLPAPLALGLMMIVFAFAWMRESR